MLTRCSENKLKNAEEKDIIKVQCLVKEIL